MEKIKKYLNTNVYEESMSRIHYIFNEFDNIQISFSGGKDSGVMVELVMEYIKKYKPTNNISLYTLDYEAGYEQTITYVDKIIKRCEPFMDIYNICLPIQAQNSVNSEESFWRPWDFKDEEIWVRELPNNAIHDKNNDFDFDYYNMTDYEFNTAFTNWLHNKNNATNTGVLVGVRADESLNRLRIFYNDKNKYNNKSWSTKIIKNIYSLFPIYDWHTKDIWKYNSDKEYNKLYDLMYQAGVPLGSMRVASPFNDCAISSLYFFKAINPTMWGKMVGRVQGVNTAALYGNTKVYGWKDIKLPPNHNWKSYTDFLLSTLTDKARDNYLKKFNTSVKFWKEKGGALSSDIIKQMDDKNIKYINNGPKSKASQNDVITFDEYPDELDIKDWKSVGSYKRMAVAILRNDHTCKILGFGPTKKEIDKRKNAENLLKGKI